MPRWWRAPPSLTRSLPALKNHKPLKKRSADPRFAWQDKAADLAASVSARAAARWRIHRQHGLHRLRQDLGNAPHHERAGRPATGLRCAFAMGLHAHAANRARVPERPVAERPEQLAIRSAVRPARRCLNTGDSRPKPPISASSQTLLDRHERGTDAPAGNDQHPLLQRLTDDAKSAVCLPRPCWSAPWTTTPATESLRGGRQIAPHAAPADRRPGAGQARRL